MGPENRIDPNAFALFLGDAPIAQGEIALTEIALPPETMEQVKELICPFVKITLTIKTPKYWRYKSRKRFIKLMMSERIGRNYAERLADFVRGWMPYGKVWREYIWSKL